MDQGSKSIFMSFVFETHDRRQDGLLVGSPLNKDSSVGIYNVRAGRLPENFIDYMKTGIRELIERYENAS